MTRRLLIIGTWLLIATICRSHPVMNAYLEMVESDDGTTSVIWRHPSSTATGMNLEPLYPAEVKAAATLPSQEEGGYLREYYVLRGAPRFWSGCAIGLKGTTSRATEVLVRLKLANGQTRVAVLRSSADVFIVPEQAGRGQAAAAYFQLGVDHILKGVDHLLFVLGLLLLVPGRLMLIKTITSFTVAHSITLAIATLGYASAPLPPLNVAIAFSIFYLGPEIIRQQRGKTSLTIRHPWLIAFVFGLLHGFSFASGLTSLGLPHADIPFALLLFNLGVEFGQLGFVFLVLALVHSFNRLEIVWPRWVAALPCYTVGSLGAFWTIQRAAILFQS
ncbi:MAG TPA: HupE/UreJ family protein [Candidatus Acidoferrales bacterium]|nr:HupE/UreJ family protein [Candidatus Acidoferrales bacterium]